jgi:hypothetical protein
MRVKESPLARHREMLVRQLPRDPPPSLELNDSRFEHPARDSLKMLVAMGV